MRYTANEYEFSYERSFKSQLKEKHLEPIKYEKIEKHRIKKRNETIEKFFSNLDLDSISIQKSKDYYELMVKNNIINPDLDESPNNEIIFTWQNKNIGIVSILFDKKSNINFFAIKVGNSTNYTMKSKFLKPEDTPDEFIDFLKMF